MSGLLFVCLLWVGMCGGFFALATFGEILDKLCDKFPRLAKIVDGDIWEED